MTINTTCANTLAEMRHNEGDDINHEDQFYNAVAGIKEEIKAVVIKHLQGVSAIDVDAIDWPYVEGFINDALDDGLSEERDICIEKEYGILPKSRKNALEDAVSGFFQTQALLRGRTSFVRVMTHDNESYTTRRHILRHCATRVLSGGVMTYLTAGILYFTINMILIGWIFG